MNICSEWDNMARTKQSRFIQQTPPVSLFKPAGVPARQLARIVLRLDEYEALRLSDLEGLTQEEVAERLGVSRPTVSRILEAGRRSVMQALAEGKALIIEGGPVRFGPPPWAGRGRRRFRGGRGDF